MLVGVAEGDTEREVKWLAQKLVKLKIFSSQGGNLQQSIQDVDASALIVSQFTLLASCNKGVCPSYSKAAAPKIALDLYTHFVNEVRDQGVDVQTGEFGANMDIALVNQGPYTILLEKVSEKIS